MNLSPEGYLHESLVRIDQRAEKSLLDRTSDALANDGDVIYIRKIDGRLQWMRGNVLGGGQHWQDLTPHLAKDRLRKDSVGLVDDVSLEKLRDMLATAQNPDSHEIGWYQDSKGDLYQFDGTTWIGTLPTEDQMKTLEYLGK
jgi:hypothetical protein